MRFLHTIYEKKTVHFVVDTHWNVEPVQSVVQ